MATNILATKNNSPENVSLPEQDMKTFFGNSKNIEPGAKAPEKEAVKSDMGKTDWTLLPFEALEDIVKVLEFGAQKYSRDNWRVGDGFSWTRVANSLLRHTFAWIRGEDRDPESGLSHLAHMGCNVLFLLYYSKYKERYLNDDRFKS